MSFSGITFLNKHTYRDLGVTISSREIGDPSKNKVLRTIANSNVVYDFSEIYGDQTYTPRLLRYVFNLFPYGLSSSQYMDSKKTQFVNFLMNSRGKQPLYDDDIPGYYFLAEVEEGSIYNKWTDGTVEVSFVAYPFKIAELPEGNDIWDEFNFELDVAQPVEFEVPRTTFKRLSIGEEVTVGAWSTSYDTGGSIPKNVLGAHYRIVDVRETDRNRSEWAYYLEPLGEWVIEQDIVQAQEGGIHITLINPGIQTVVPTVEVSRGSTDGITIIMNNISYNMWSGINKNDLFSLKPGENELFITANNSIVKFNFYKELI